MFGWWQLAAWLAATLITSLLTPRPRGEAVRPGGLSELGIPLAEDGAVLPVAFGVCWIRNPTVLWYGNLTAAPIYESGTVIGHRYFLTLHYGICHGPLDPLGLGKYIELRFDEWRQPDPAVTDHGDFWQMQFNSGTLFGAREIPGEGGFIGRVDLYRGTTTQTSNGHLESLLGPLPGYRGLAHAVFTFTEFGNSPNLRPVSFVVKRCPNSLGLTGGAHDIAGDANPAAMIFDILTDRRWGLGIPAGAIDVANFQAVGQALATEGFGLSMLFDTAAPARDFIEEILRHVDGALYTDPTTGLLSLKLARADYVFADLPILDESMVDSCVMQRRAWEDTTNLVRVHYNWRLDVNGGGMVEKVAAAQDLANMQIRGGDVVAIDIPFRGLTTPGLAQTVAARALKTESYPIATFELVCNRTAWALRPGSVFRLQRPSLGITDMVCRVARPRSGALTDGKIRIDASEDIWGIDWTAYTPPPPSGWVPPDVQPAGWGQLWGEYWGGPL